jgi:hypothetical protein
MVNMKSNRFIMLDVSETINLIEVGKSYPNVQIIPASGKIYYPDIETIKNRTGSKINSEEKRVQLFTITLKDDSDYKTV